MNHRPRFAFTHGQKAILWIGSFLCLWQFMQVPAVVDAMLDFYAAGIVPGTTIVLAPDTVLRLLFAFVFSVAAVLFYRRFGRKPARSSVPSERTDMELRRMLALLYRKYVWLPGDYLIHPARRRYVWLAKLSRRLPARKVARFLAAAGVRIGRLLVAAGAAAERAANRAVRFLATAMVYVGMALGAATKLFWRHAEPAIRQFDRYLHRKVHQYEAGVVAVSMARSVIRTSNELRQRITAVPGDHSEGS